MQFAKAYITIEVTVLGMVMLFKFAQYLNDASPIVLMPLGIEYDVRPLGANEIISVPFLINNRLSDEAVKTEFPPSTVKLLNLEQSINGFQPIFVMLAGIVMLVKFKQEANAPPPMVVTVFGIVIDVKLELFLNAPRAITVTGLPL